jgi:hypothetical protein
MKQIEVFPFSRDGYRYDVQPGFSPVFEVKDSPEYVIHLVAPCEFGAVDAVVPNTEDGLENAIHAMQDKIHRVITSLEAANYMLLLNKKGREMLYFYYDNLNITNL